MKETDNLHFKLKLISPALVTLTLREELIRSLEFTYPHHI